MMQNTFSQQFTFLMQFAKDQLAKRNEFYPFASIVETNGELHPLAFHPGVENPPPQMMIDEFNRRIPDLIREQAIVAAAVCLNGASKASQPVKEAIIIEMENAAGEAATIAVPYRQVRNRFEYDEPVISERAPKWFVREKSA